MNDVTTHGTLVVARHGESEWNLLGKWTGWTDVSITRKGHDDAVKMGELLRDYHFDVAYTSNLKRTQETLDAILEGKGDQADVPRIASHELTERDYGDYTGMNKWEVKEKVGDEEFNGIRRGWDWPIPGGESLKEVYARVYPYFDSEILPRLQRGESVLIVAHGNSDRALMKHLENISEDDMAHVEMPFGKLLVYTFDHDNDVPIAKDELQAEIEQTKA